MMYVYAREWTALSFILFEFISVIVLNLVFFFSYYVRVFSQSENDNVEANNRQTKNLCINYQKKPDIFQQKESKNYHY